MPATISINRAPVLTLFAAVVTKRLGFRWDESLSLGKTLAGLNAHSKARRLGIFKPHEEKTKASRERDHGEQFCIALCGRPAADQNTADYIRTVTGRAAVTAEGADAYPAMMFCDYLGTARAAMTMLARTLPPRELAAEAFILYEVFRPHKHEGRERLGDEGGSRPAADQVIRQTVCFSPGNYRLPGHGNFFWLAKGRFRMERLSLKVVPRSSWDDVVGWLGNVT